MFFQLTIQNFYYRFRQDNRNNTTPQRQNNSNRSTPNNTPNKTPDKPIQGKSPVVNQNKPVNQTPKSDDSKTPMKTEKRERSRSPLTPPPTFKSPILTKPIPSKQLPKSSPSQKKELSQENSSKDNKNNKNQQSTSSNKANNDSNDVRYRGRPGEKKFSNRCRLFVANLNASMTEEDVRALFTPYGEVSESYYNKDKGFGFVRLVSIIMSHLKIIFCS